MRSFPAMRRLATPCGFYFDPLQLLQERLDSRRDFASLDLPISLLPLQRRELLDHGTRVLPLELALEVLEALRQLIALGLEPGAIVAQLLDEAGCSLDALREPVEVVLYGNGFGHLSLSRPPHSFATAATIRS